MKQDSPRKQNENPGPGEQTHIVTPRKTMSPSFSLGSSERPCLMKAKVTGSTLDQNAHETNIKFAETGGLMVKITTATTHRQDAIKQSKLPGPGS